MTRSGDVQLGPARPSVKLVFRAFGPAPGFEANTLCVAGAAIPLVAVAYASRSGFMRARDSTLTRIERAQRGSAVLLGGMGIAILTGADQWLQARVLAWLLDAGVDLRIGN